MTWLGRRNNIFNFLLQWLESQYLWTTEMLIICSSNACLKTPFSHHLFIALYFGNAHVPLSVAWRLRCASKLLCRLCRQDHGEALLLNTFLIKKVRSVSIGHLINWCLLRLAQEIYFALKTSLESYSPKFSSTGLTCITKLKGALQHFCDSLT